MYADPDHQRSRALQNAIDEKKTGPFGKETHHEFSIELPQNSSGELDYKLKAATIMKDDKEMNEFLCLDTMTVASKRAVRKVDFDSVGLDGLLDELNGGCRVCTGRAAKFFLTRRRAHGNRPVI